MRRPCWRASCSVAGSRRRCGSPRSATRPGATTRHASSRSSRRRRERRSSASIGTPSRISAPDRSSQEGFQFDERHYHFGLVRADGQPEAPAPGAGGGRAAGGRGALTALTIGPGRALRDPPARHHRRRRLHRRQSRRPAGPGGRHVLIFDSLAPAGRRGATSPGCRAAARRAARRSRSPTCATRYALRDCGRRRRARSSISRPRSRSPPVSPTRSTTSRSTPRHAQPAGGAAAAGREPPPLLFTSTNKVYGKLDAAGSSSGEPTTRWQPRDGGSAPGLRRDARRSTSTAPMAAPRASADQYVLDYARIFGLRDGRACA